VEEVWDCASECLRIGVAILSIMTSDTKIIRNFIDCSQKLYQVPCSKPGGLLQRMLGNNLDPASSALIVKLQTCKADKAPCTRLPAAEAPMNFLDRGRSIDVIN